MSLRTNCAGLVLRRFEAADAEVYVALVQANREHLSRHGDFAEAVGETVDEAGTAFDCENSTRSFGLWLDDELIGRADLVDRGEGGFSVGYWIDEQHQGRGLMTAALTALLHYGTETLKATVLFAGVTHGNTTSDTLLQRLGFAPESNRGTYTRYRRRAGK